MPRRNSVNPTKVHAKDQRFAFHRLVGTVSTFPESFDCDAGITNPNQNLDGRPTECTAYTICDIATDQDDREYSHDYQFMKTLELMGVPPDSEGADARVAYKVPVAFGLLAKELEPESMKKNSQAFAANPDNWDVALDKKTVKKPAYLPIQKNPGKDWFDSIRSAILLQNSLPSKERRPVGMATRWSPQFTTRILPDNPKSLYWGHMYKAKGWDSEAGVDYMNLKTWEGTLRKMSRYEVNKLMSEWGSYAGTLRDIPEGTLDELLGQKVTFMQAVIALLQNLLKIKLNA